MRMSTKGTKHFSKFYLHFTYKYQQYTYLLNQTRLDLRKEKWSLLNRDLPVQLQRAKTSEKLKVLDDFLTIKIEFTWVHMLFILKIDA